MTTDRDIEAVALTLVSESKQPHEWSELCWVIRNRTEAGGFPDTPREVVMAAHQFSAWNEYMDMNGHEAFEAMKQRYWDSPLFDSATDEARETIADDDRRFAPFGHNVLNYWSPRSMKPTAGILPDWDWQKLRVFTVSGIDPWRFCFAETVHRSHPLAGNVMEVAGRFVPSPDGEEGTA